MVKAGLSSDLIVNAIKGQAGNFSLAATELIRLKNEGVPEPVISAMMSAKPSPTTVAAGSPPTSSVDPADPASSHAAGIWLFEEKEGKRAMTLLRSASFKDTKARGLIGASIAPAFGKIKMNSVVEGATASTRTTNPVFYLYFSANPFAAQQQFGASAGDQNLKQVTLVKATTRGSTREFTLSQASAVAAFGKSSTTNGVADKDQVHFTAELIHDGVYRVTFSPPLTPGEYIFLFSNGLMGAQSAAQMGNAFDFGVDK